MRLTAMQMARLSRLLDEALPLLPEQRRAWLDALSTDDQPLLQSLRATLLTDESADLAGAALLDDGPRISADAPAGRLTAAGHEVGERVGAYQLLRMLGSGGMAHVWLARRADGAFERQVALKIPRLDQVTTGMAERFARECNILASLEYPGIARLYDAGVAANGTPFIAMEYVQGQMLTEWCDARSLDTSGRLDVFLQILDAVSFAHARQVIHRDLKPSNILVTDQGQVRLLDFGIARLLEDRTTHRPSVTRSYGRALTPEYASPELLRGDPIDVRSDIYALGIVLRELLTGVRQTHSAAKPAGGARDINLGDNALAVINRALANNPDNRYPDVGSLAADIRSLLPADATRKRATLPASRLKKLAFAAAAMAAVGMLLVAIFRHQTASTPAPGSSPISPAAPTATTAPPSVAVMPFVDLSENRDHGYLSDGVAEELVGLLTKIPQLRVTARASSFAFRDQPNEIATIASKLQVNHVLEGSIRRSGQKLRVSVRLVQASTGTSIWSETYDREMKDIFELQESVANAVVDALKIQLLTRQSIPASQRTQNAKAYEEYLLGRQYLDGYARDRQQRAREAFQRAVKLDPSFAPAYAGMAQAAANIGSMTLEARWFDIAKTEAERALTSAPGLSDAYVARAQVRMSRDWDWDGAKTDIDAALGLDPNNVALLQIHGAYLSAQGRIEEALAIRRQSVQQNPMSSNSWDMLATELMGSGDLAGARRAFDRAQELSPYNDFRMWVRSILEVSAGNFTEAIRLANQLPDPNQRNYVLALAEFSLGHVAESRSALQRLRTRAPDLFAAQIAIAYAWQGEKDQAFQWLDRAVELHDIGLSNIKTSRFFDSLRGDPRFSRALQKMRLAG